MGAKRKRKEDGTFDIEYASEKEYIEKSYILGDIERFYHDSPIGVCWEYTKAKDGSFGYGSLPISMSERKAHRLAYKVLVGPIGDSLVLHKCDNPCCINPVHLFLGTHKDNADDMISKSRGDWSQSKHGTQKSFSVSRKLTEELVYEIKSLLSIYSDSKIASMFNCSRRNICKIRHGLTWKHVIYP
jgi:hypothetical protein